MNYSSHRDFHIWDYNITFRQLLLRSIPEEPEGRNIDIAFWCVDWISLPGTISGLTIGLASPQAFSIAMQSYPLPKHEKIFHISSGGRDFFVAALGCRVMENTLGPRESGLIYAHIDRKEAEYGELLLLL